jgi:CTP:phosphocholine cytidylyltransferase-like protein
MREHRIMNGKRPCKSNRPKERAKIFDHCVIKRTIHGLYSRKIAPIVSIIHKGPKNENKIGPKYKISSECTLSQNNKKHYNNIFS